MNWNLFKRAEPVRDEAVMDLMARVEKLERTSIAQAMEEIKGLRLLLQQLQLSVRSLESGATTPSIHDVHLQQKLEAEKEEHKRTYAREYYYRKKANMPTMKQLQMQARKKAQEGQV
jgi:hypothetical protein